MMATIRVVSACGETHGQPDSGSDGADASAGSGAGASNGTSTSSVNVAGSRSTNDSAVSGSNVAAGGAPSSSDSGGSSSTVDSGASDGTGGAGTQSGSGAEGGSVDDVGSGGSAEEPPNPFDYPIDPDSLAGCRSPEEEHCLECCQKVSDETRCYYLRASTDTNQSDQDPWYNNSSIEDGPCPNGCNPCADCSIRDEEALRALEEREGCDCETVELLGDDCFIPTSCECHCATIHSLMEECPPAE